MNAAAGGASGGADRPRLSPEQRARLADARGALGGHLRDGVVAFWAERAVDPVHGGYLTCYDAAGRLDERDTDKYLVTQTRMVWGFAALHAAFPEDPRFRPACAQGVDFLVRHFWDARHGGWRWRVRRGGAPVDDGKVVYGQSFAVYALADAARWTGDARALDYAARTFDLLQVHAADTARGGYYENLEPDWSLSAAGFAGGDRKSLDTHMHLLEAFTSLALATGAAVHRRRLAEVADVVLARMVDPASGCGRNQFTLDFAPVPAIAIRRTWNAERAGDAPAVPTDTTSYGHNLELGWLLARADEALGRGAGAHAEVVRRLADHAIRFGLDPARGGLYRDGPHDGPALVRDKEFWQQAEALPGFLCAYESTGDARFLDAFHRVWEFAERYVIDPALGEWRVLVAEDGRVLDGSMGNPWKAFYHTGRAVLESLARADRLLAGGA